MQTNYQRALTRDPLSAVIPFQLTTACETLASPSSPSVKQVSDLLRVRNSNVIRVQATSRVKQAFSNRVLDTVVNCRVHAVPEDLIMTSALPELKSLDLGSYNKLLSHQPKRKVLKVPPNGNPSGFL